MTYPLLCLYIVVRLNSPYWHLVYGEGLFRIEVEAPMSSIKIEASESYNTESYNPVNRTVYVTPARFSI